MKIFCYTKDTKVARRSLDSIPEISLHFTKYPSWDNRDEVIYFTMARIAQSVERLTAEWEVAGSIPGAGAILRVLK